MTSATVASEQLPLSLESLVPSKEVGREKGLKSWEGGRFCEWCGGVKRGRGKGYCPDKVCNEHHKHRLLGYAPSKAIAAGVCYRCKNLCPQTTTGFCKACDRAREQTSKKWSKFRSRNV